MVIKPCRIPGEQIYEQAPTEFSMSKNKITWQLLPLTKHILYIDFGRIRKQTQLLHFQLVRSPLPL